MVHGQETGTGPPSLHCSHVFSALDGMEDSGHPALLIGTSEAFRIEETVM